MNCPNCQESNRDEARYCRRCGWWLVPSCPFCESVLPYGVFFCDYCGRQLAVTPAQSQSCASPQLATSSAAKSASAPLRLAELPEPEHGSSSRSAISLDSQSIAIEEALNNTSMVGERRVVTMLFCDVKGSTAAAEQLDPEDWTEIINGVFERMIRPVRKYDGTIARLMGDSVLAFFGAPVAHEDDPQRAVLAGLAIVAEVKPYCKEMRQRWGVDFDVRVGINTGLVVVGKVGTDNHVEYTALGDAINLAARMEQTAAPGTVQIAEETYQRVAPFFEIQDLGGIEVKGKSKPIRSFRVLKATDTLARSQRIAGRVSPLIGREREFEQLTSAIQELNSGKGGILFVSGEAGLGKSRLLDELRREMAESDSEFRWFQATSLSYESSQPYHLILRLLRQVSGISEADSAEDISHKMDLVLTHIPEAKREQTRRVLQALFGMVDREGRPRLEGETFKAQLYVSMQAFWQAWSTKHATVLVFDDLHWSDTASIALLSHLFALATDTPLLFLCAMRVDRDSSAWVLKTETDSRFPHLYDEITLQPLSQPESVTMMEGLLEVADLPERLRIRILDRTAGNPLFVEEIVQALIENGTLFWDDPEKRWIVRDERDGIDIPDNLHSLLVSRIDRLPDAARSILQIASVVGRSFFYRVLERVLGQNDQLDQQLLSLQRVDLIRETGRRPEKEYVFRHALVHEAAYKTILRRQRLLYHQQVGEAIETIFCDQLDNHASVLAGHFSRAGDTPRAMKYHTQAGDSAFRLFANVEAEEHYSLALKVAAQGEPTTEQLIHLYSRQGRALELAARIDEAAGVYSNMEQEARTLGSGEMELAALIALGTLYCTPTSLLDPDRGEALSESALALARALGDRKAEAKIFWNLLNMNRLSNRPENALKSGERSLAIARELDLHEQIAYSLSDLCHVYNLYGRYEKSKQSLRETHALWRELGNLPMLADNLSTASYVDVYTGDFESAIMFSDEAREISESVQSMWGISYCRWMLGLVMWERGQVDQAIETMQACIDAGEQAGFMGALVYTRADLGLIYAELGDMPRAIETVGMAVNSAGGGRSQWRPYAQLNLARVHLLAGNHPAAADVLAEIERSSAPHNVVQPHVTPMAACALSAAQGNHAQAIQLMEQRLAGLQEYGLKLYLPETLFHLGVTLAQTDRLDEALPVLDQGLDISLSIGSQWSAWRILAAQAEMAVAEQSARQRSDARARLSAIAATVQDTGLHSSFLKRPDVRELMEDLS
ncbi:MAG: AAA family ATPase [Chloroflexi bacterium]|nr:AAA family ATPase [Chloroflexota bacterium]